MCCVEMIRKRWWRGAPLQGDCAPIFHFFFVYLGDFALHVFSNDDAESFKSICDLS